MNRKALVSIAIGEPYTTLFKDYVLPSWRRYADFRGYDIHVFYDRIDKSDRGSSRAPHWQKLLAVSHPSLSNYEQLVWLDSDVMINAFLAPDVASCCPVEKIGCVSDRSVPTWSEARIFRNAEASMQDIARIFQNGHSNSVQEERRLNYLENRQPSSLSEEDRTNSLKRTLEERGISFGELIQFNSGVMVLSPRLHADIFEETYYKYEDVFRPLNDNIPLIVEVNKRNILHSLDSRFNVLFGLEMFESYPFALFASKELPSLLRLCSTSLYLRSFFLHFAGTYSYMPYVNTSAKYWMDIVSDGLEDKIVFPNREVPGQRFNLESFSTYQSIHQVSLLPVSSHRNWRDRYGSGKGVDENGIFNIVFDASLNCIGIRGPELTPSGAPIRWTGEASEAVVAIERPLLSLNTFRFLIKFEGGPKIADGMSITINDIECYPLAIEDAHLWSFARTDDESKIIRGAVPENLGHTLVIKLYHPYLTAKRSDSSDKRRLGIAITRLAFTSEMSPPKPD